MKGKEITKDEEQSFVSAQCRDVKIMSIIINLNRPCDNNLARTLRCMLMTCITGTYVDH